MDLFTYTSFAEPEKTLRFIRKYSRIEVNNAQELSENLREVYKNLTNEEKEDFLLNLAEIHPDKDLLDEALKDPEPKEKEAKCNCPICSNHRMMNNEISTSHVIGTHVGANGLNAVGHYMNNSGLLTARASGIENDDIKDVKNENMVRNMLNDRIFKYIITGAVLFLIWKTVKK